jgi:ubiquinone/menaquinone biosynthesis C-methylase UbiE
MTPTAHDYFGSIAGSYDSLIARAVPRYEEMISTLIGYLPAAADRILELGCGTGNLSLQLAARYPAGAITYVDAAPEMIDVTRERLERDRPESVERASFLVCRFEDLELDGAGYDLVVSSISLHHVLGKDELYRGIHRGMQDGGRFCFADQLRGMPEENHRHNWEQWLAFCRRPGGCTVEEITTLLDHAEAHDHYTPLEEHFALLAHAGFHSLDCVWRNLIWGIVTATAGEG